MSDAVSNWMEITSTYGVLVARNKLSHRWALELPARPTIAFHLVEKGHACVRVVGQAPVRIAEGELVLVPHGQAHVIGDSPATPPCSLDELKQQRMDARPHVTTLVCGEYQSELGLCSQMTRQLPDVVHFTAEAIRKDPSLRVMIPMLCEELASVRPGRETVIEHLLGALLACALRAWSASPEGGWPAALVDVSLGPVMSAIHARPQKAWTVESLAKVAHLSRAAFARRFRETVGEPPLEYVTRVRMSLAAQHLRGSAKLSEVASAVGYTSEFAFSRAFKRALGVSPREHRAMAQAARR
ncbi:MAG: AraC family transcriptional regulator [Kofleriaceae bacterium]|nr:AraC family transcriptional regulator [Kofleriaceae bacterium]